jgi:tetratricopeptide (TPR) repeat protein
MKNLMVKETDWYKNKKWDASIEKEFFNKLHRSRSQKYQHLKTQAAKLVDKYPNKALELIELYFEGASDHFWDAEASATKAMAYISLNKVEQAIDAFEESLENLAKHGGTNPSIDLHYPFYVALNGLKQYYDRVLTILEGIKHEPVLPWGIFKYYASLAIILYEKNASNKNIILYIDKALAASELQTSGLPYHKKLGLVVVGKYSKTIRQLKSIRKNITIAAFIQKSIHKLFVR